MHNDIKEILVTEEQIREKCKELGSVLSEDYKNKKPLVVGLLKGCVPFIGDLAKNISAYIQIDYMDVSSYHGGTQSSGEIRILKDLSTSVKGRHVIIAEDIVDTGRTLKEVISLFESRGALSVRVVTLLDKPEGRIVDIEADYIGFTIPKAFVVGYGLDYGEYEFYRNLPYVGVLKEEVYS
ncbi:hypoxanthine phosphoribosyltransferase [Haloplasma contractile]|uniref:Hypoxanthine phosphoribosyltransferase n=1 Tax=Haloplasma contractile SSD-17B TaxID=1033810 RepID=U2ECD0_9MOLU|nr:hypoxanthine phosphoribosyltransferase [Haloplasma contractile]ERJ12431.1 Phosphoribosyl transferase domain protein [Haloplasma contractile SSD-17B]